MRIPTMRTHTRPIIERARVWLAALLAVISFAVAHGNAVGQSQRAYTQPELDQMLAPIALYPDPLLSQILMASTYPIEVVEAARWSRANPGLQGDTAVRGVENMDWDPSVKSLVAFPDVLAHMDQNLEWTRQLGDAFLVQEPQVMETVQRLRQQARAAGTLASDARVRVLDDGPIIVVQPVDPQVIYVPYYDPRVAYGTWWWPTYPPVFWAPWPGYAVHYPRPGFFWGPAVRVSVGFFFGAVDWPHRQVRVVSVSNYYYRPAVRRSVHATQVNVAPGPWRHDPWHRRGLSYRPPEVQQRFAPAAPPREVHHAPAPRSEAAQPRSQPQTARPVSTPSAPAARVTRGTARRDERTDAHRGVPPADPRVGTPQPGGAASRPATPAAAPRPQNGAAPPVRSEPARERSRERPRPATAAPSVPRQASVGAPPNPGAGRNSRRADVRDAGARRQENRPDARAPAVHPQPPRDADGQRRERPPPDSQVDQQHRPRRDGRG
jgi:Protein of unknown function (DUF3300)